jgi:hypothetical protein
MPFFENSSREDLRKVYLAAWRKHRQRLPMEPLEAQIVGVIEEHPEYHELLDDPDTALTTDFSPESGRVNPFLHMAIHLAIRDQVATDRPAGIRAAYKTLSRRRGALDAEHAIGEHLAKLIWQAQRSSQPPDVDAYLRRVQRMVR